MSSGEERLTHPATAIRERARELGFHAVGFAPARPVPDPEHARYRRFIERGYHGEMAYLAEHAEVRRRIDTAALVAGAQTVICLTRRYGRSAAAERTDPPLARLLARYARGRDYHGFLRKKAQQLAAFCRTLGQGVRARAFCDTAPILERSWAARAGLGFIGKNGSLIVPGQGSYCLLAEVVTTLAVRPAVTEPPAQPPADGAEHPCGSCRRCLDACPAQALVEPFVLDARRCIAYATIERRAVDPAEPPPGQGQARLFGCDECQQVCPYNAVAPPPAAETAPFQPLPRWAHLRLADLVQLTRSGWPELAAGSPLGRAGRVGLARNALLVAAYRCRQGHAEMSRVLELGREHDDPRIRQLATALLRQVQS